MKTLNFKKLSFVTASIAMILFVLLLLLPGLIFDLFGISGSDSAEFMARRASMLFLGISVICWMGRRSNHSTSRQATCMGLGIAMLALAVLGLVELLRGFVGAGILLAVTTELILSAAYFNIWFIHRDN